MFRDNLKSLQIDGRRALGFRADGAVLPYQTLTDDADQCRGNDIAVQSQIANSEECRNRISGVNSREDQMTCHSRMKGCLGCFAVAYLSYQDNVGILPKN